mmetsp:Transcript_14826/g.26655  ORF Transcript_14826/g.26655 Transcript_14826/m.26655 type:complete len:297 (+) Transcript_14826:836-1726(+)
MIRGQMRVEEVQFSGIYSCYRLGQPEHWSYGLFVGTRVLVLHAVKEHQRVHDLFGEMDSDFHRVEALHRQPLSLSSRELRKASCSEHVWIVGFEILVNDETAIVHQRVERDSIVELRADISLSTAQQHTAAHEPQASLSLFIMALFKPAELWRKPQPLSENQPSRPGFEMHTSEVAFLVADRDDLADSEVHDPKLLELLHHLLVDFGVSAVPGVQAVDAWGDYRARFVLAKPEDVGGFQPLVKQPADHRERGGRRTIHEQLLLDTVRHYSLLILVLLLGFFFRHSSGCMTCGGGVG